MTSIRCPEKCGGIEMTAFQLENTMKGCEVKKVYARIAECAVGPGSSLRDRCRIQQDEVGIQYELFPAESKVKIKCYKQGELIDEKEMEREGTLKELLEDLAKRQDSFYAQLAPTQIHEVSEAIPKELAFKMRYKKDGVMKIK